MDWLHSVLSGSPYVKSMVYCTQVNVSGIQLLSDAAADVRRIIDLNRLFLEETFKKVHADPEPAFMEFKTSKIIAEHLRKFGFEVKEGLGGTGIVGIMRNGDGPTVWYRADMDALPIREETGLPYISTKVARDHRGNDVPVAHQCGHDAHVAWLMGASIVMAKLKDRWSGTLVFIAQPAEEIIGGARAMVEDGLQKIVPHPDYVIGMHGSTWLPTGSFDVTPGRRLAGTDQLDVEFYGVGGHGSAPEYCKDPVLMAATAVMMYQNIVSRNVDPQEPAVLTVGAIQAGTAHNIIPDRALLMINIRWWTQEVRKQMIESIERISRSVAMAAGMPEGRMPAITCRGSSLPTINDVPLADMIKRSLACIAGPDRVSSVARPFMGSEDFPILFSGMQGVRSVFVEAGIVPPEVMEKAKENNVRFPYYAHQPEFYVDIKAIASGAEAASMMLLGLLSEQET